MTQDLIDGRSYAKRKGKPRALTPREQLALTILADEWSNKELTMCFEISNPDKYKTDLCEESVQQIARFEARQAAQNVE